MNSQKYILWEYYWVYRVQDSICERARSADNDRMEWEGEKEGEKERKERWKKGEGRERGWESVRRKRETETQRHTERVPGWG